MNPKLSVIMAVHNEELYVEEAIQSILNQTFQDFEFIIVDDCSTDGTPDIIKKFNSIDDRIKLIRNSEQLKLPGSLNRGIKNAKAEWIARMDGDDVSLPSRFQMQLDYLDKNPEVDVLGSWLIKILTDGSEFTRWQLPESHNLLIWKTLFSNPFFHGTVIFRKELFEKTGGYDENAVLEDLDFWIRMAPFARFACLPEYLYKHRESEKIRIKKEKYRCPLANELHFEFIRSIVDKDLNEDLFNRLSICQGNNTEKFNFSDLEIIELVSLTIDLFNGLLEKNMLDQNNLSDIHKIIITNFKNILSHMSTQKITELDFHTHFPRYKTISFWQESGLPKIPKMIGFLVSNPRLAIRLIKERVI